MKEKLRDTIIFALVGLGFTIYKLINLIPKKKRGYHCKTCGEKILNGTGVIINNKQFFYCRDCVRRGAL